jgi:hypothetical protein
MKGLLGFIRRMGEWLFLVPRGWLIKEDGWERRMVDG